MGTIKVGKRRFRWGWEKKRHAARKKLALARSKPLSRTPTAQYVEAVMADRAAGVIVSWSSGDSGAKAWLPYTVEYKPKYSARWRSAGVSDRHFGRYLIEGLKPKRQYQFRVRASGRGPELGRDISAAPTGGAGTAEPATGFSFGSSIGESVHA